MVPRLAAANLPVHHLPTRPDVIIGRGTLRVAPAPLLFPERIRPQARSVHRLNPLSVSVVVETGYVLGPAGLPGGPALYNRKRWGTQASGGAPRQPAGLSIDNPFRLSVIVDDVNALVYILLCLIWGSTWLAIKIGLSQAPPFTTAALRFVLAAVTLSIICSLRQYSYPRDLRTLLRLGYPGFYMYGLSYALVYLAERYVYSATAAVLFASYPFFVAALAWLLYRTERLSLAAWVGMALGFLGVVAISYDSLQTSGNLFMGTVFVIAASLAAAYGIVLHKHRFTHVDIVVAANVQMIFGGLFLIAGALLFESWSDFHVTVEAIGSILYLALPGTVVTFLGYYWLLKRIRLTVVSVIAFITPLVAILIGVGLADETLSFPILIGGTMILGGVLLVVRKERGAVPSV